MVARREVSYKSPLHEMTETTPTRLWNDSADIDELKYSIDNGAVGATCNPVIAVGILKKHIAEWRPPIQSLLTELPTATRIAPRIGGHVGLAIVSRLGPVHHQHVTATA